MAYQRVIPRDLFNEAKLFKSLGQLALVAHNGFDSDGKTAGANDNIRKTPFSERRIE